MKETIKIRYTFDDIFDIIYKKIMIRETSKVKDVHIFIYTKKDDSVPKIKIL